MIEDSIPQSRPPSTTRSGDQAPDRPMAWPRGSAASAESGAAVRTPILLNGTQTMNGVGPTEVYRCTTMGTQLLQTPMRWVQSKMPSYAALDLCPDPGLAADLWMRTQEDVPKVWTEIAFELTRREVAPEAPSRLTSLFACTDALEAFCFTDFGSDRRFVYRGTVLPGVRWWVVDMAEFQISRPDSPSTDAFATAWDAALARARAYWLPSSRPRQAEVLVDGPIQLDPTPLSLRRTLERRGIL